MPKKEILHTILPASLLVVSIIYILFIFDPQPLPHSHGGLAKILIYGIFTFIILPLGLGLYLSFFKNIYWLTKILSYFILIVGASIGSMMFMVYAISWMGILFGYCL